MHRAASRATGGSARYGVALGAGLVLAATACGSLVRAEGAAGDPDATEETPREDGGSAAVRRDDQGEGSRPHTGSASVTDGATASDAATPDTAPVLVEYWQWWYPECGSPLNAWSACTHPKCASVGLSIEPTHDCHAVTFISVGCAPLQVINGDVCNESGDRFIVSDVPPYTTRDLQACEVGGHPVANPDNPQLPCSDSVDAAVSDEPPGAASGSPPRLVVHGAQADPA